MSFTSCIGVANTAEIALLGQKACVKILQAGMSLYVSIFKGMP